MHPANTGSPRLRLHRRAVRFAACRPCPCMPRYGLAARVRERNTELRRTLTAFLLCLLALSATHRVAGATDEMRALWVRQTSLETEESIRRMVASASTSGFNTLFVQIGNEAAAAAQTFDPVAEAINQAHDPR